MYKEKKDLKYWLKKSEVGFSMLIFIIFLANGIITLSAEKGKSQNSIPIFPGLGQNSLIMGKIKKFEINNRDEKRNEASGDFSIATGYETTASGRISTALGMGTTASGNVSIATGSGTRASADNATAMGGGTTASGNNSTALGEVSVASGYTSTALGSGTIASGWISTAIGSGTTSSGIASTSMGHKTNALGDVSTSMGYETTALGKYSTSMGIQSEALGTGSIALGGMAEGFRTVKGGKALSNGSIALGTETIAGKTREVQNREQETIKLAIIKEAAEKFEIELTPNTDAKTTLKELNKKLRKEKGKTFDEAYEIKSMINNKIKVAIKVASAGTEEAVAIGYRTKAQGNKSISLGYDINSDGENNFIFGSNIDATGKSNVVVLGANSTALEGAVSIGNAETQRQIKFVAVGTDDTDAVNYGQLKLKADKTYVDKKLTNIEKGLLDSGTLIKGLDGVAKSNNAAIKENQDTIRKNIEDISKNNFEIKINQKKLEELRKNYISKKETDAVTLTELNKTTKKVNKIEKDLLKNGSLIKGLDGVTKSNNAAIKENQRVILDNRADIKKLDRKTSNGLASVAAMSVLDFSGAPVGRFGIGAAIGGYSGKQAIAVGTVYDVSEDLKINGKIGISTDKLKNSAWGVSGTYYFK